MDTQVLDAAGPPIGASPDERDRLLMATALAVGQRNRGNTAPNPSVGALLVRFDPDGRPVIIARAATSRGGRPHAERNAVAIAGAAARGSTCYVTLEPCSHHGATLPCSDALIEAGVARVVSALEDPNPAISGRGHAALEAAGIEVTKGVLATEAARDHAGHIRRMREGRPNVCLKMAVSADGFIGRDGAGQVAISGPISRREAHLMRATSDAILVGVGTVIADDPQLTCRLPGLLDRSPVRIVLDSHLATPPTAALFRDTTTAPVWIAAAAPADPVRRAALEAAGADVLEIPAGSDGRLDPAAAFAAFGRRGITTVMVEGGARVAAGLLARDLVDEAVIVRSPLVVGDRGISAIAGGSIDDLLADPRFRAIERRTLGPDRLVRLDRIRMSSQDPAGVAGSGPGGGTARTDARTEGEEACSPAS